MEENKTNLELLLKARSGDMTAMEAIFTRYLGLVRSIARKYFTPNGTDDDLVQAGILGILKGIQNYDPAKNDNLGAYMSMCIKSNIKDCIRAANRERNKPLNEAISIEKLDETGTGLSGEYIDDPLYNYIEQEGLELFYQIVEKLCNKQAVQVLRYYLEGYTYNEIASMMHLDAKKVDNILSGVKAKIKKNEKLFCDCL